MIEDFSGGYYRHEMNVQEYDDGPVIEQGLYEFINQYLYTDSNVPVMMRLGLDAGALFDVSAESAVPRDTLALPRDLFDSSGKQSVYVLKPEYANTVGFYHG